MWDDQPDAMGGVGCIMLGCIGAIDGCMGCIGVKELMPLLMVLVVGLELAGLKVAKELRLWSGVIVRD